MCVCVYVCVGLRVYMNVCECLCVCVCVCVLFSGLPSLAMMYHSVENIPSEIHSLFPFSLLCLSLSPLSLSSVPHPSLLSLSLSSVPHPSLSPLSLCPLSLIPLSLLSLSLSCPSSPPVPHLLISSCP